MALVNCPDCGKAVSTAAAACPNCGYPLAPAVERETIVQEVPPPAIEKETFPKWILVPVVIIGTLLIFMLFFLYRQGADDNRNVNVNVSARRASNDTSDRATPRTNDEPNQVTIPPTSETNVTTVPPGTESTTTTTIPASTPVPDRGTLTLEAKVQDRSGGTRAVSDEEFYLLDKDLESILRDADIETEAGQTLVNTFGLSVLYPDRYSEINRKALAEINKHVVYDTLTGSDGEGKISNIKPDSYYLFGITKTANGFAIWTSPVTIIAGENKLNLRPQRLTEITR